MIKQVAYSELVRASQFDFNIMSVKQIFMLLQTISITHIWLGKV